MFSKHRVDLFVTEVREGGEDGHRRIRGIGRETGGRAGGGGGGGAGGVGGRI